MRAELGLIEPEAPPPVPQPQPDIRDGQSGWTIEDHYARAPANRAALVEAGQAIERDGVRWMDGGVKDRSTAQEKISRKGYADASGLTDVVRGALIVDAPGPVDAIAADLLRRFPGSVDEGWAVHSGGYVDRKINVRFADGQVGEVQIVDRAMWDAKKAGQKLYQERRQLAQGSSEADVLKQREEAIYAAARTSAWEPIYATMSGENAGGANLVRQASSDMSGAVSSTSSASTSRQPDLPPAIVDAVPNAQALNVDRLDASGNTSTAGRLSQLQNNTRGSAIVDTSTANVSTESADGNPELFVLDLATDAEGAPTMRSAADVIAEVDAEDAAIAAL